MVHKECDEAIKKEVIEAIMKGGRSAAQVARGYEQPLHRVYSWTRVHKSKNDLARHLAQK